MPGTFFPPPRVSDPDMLHGTCVTRVPWCMPGSPTSGFLWSRWRGKRSRHSRRMRNPQFYVSGKRRMMGRIILWALPHVHMCSPGSLIGTLMSCQRKYTPRLWDQNAVHRYPEIYLNVEKVRQQLMDIPYSHIIRIDLLNLTQLANITELLNIYDEHKCMQAGNLCNWALEKFHSLLKEYFSAHIYDQLEKHWHGMFLDYVMDSAILCMFTPRSSWWCWSIFSALLALCEGNPPATSGFPSQRPVTQSFDVFFDLRLSKQQRRRWFETPSRSLRLHCNVLCHPLYWHS